MRLLIFGLLIIGYGCMTTETNAQDHQEWDRLLQKHVSLDGVVDYEGFKKDRTQLDKYLKQLSGTSVKKLSAKGQKVFWINAYNGYTVQLILDNYPLKSIMDLKFKGKDAWSYPFIQIDGKTYTLNNIEHDILRKEFPDPRIHFAVNCASASCPKLANKAFEVGNIDSLMDTLTKAYVNDKSQNKLSANSVKISEIFKWYQEDFVKSGTLIDFLNKYSTTKINKNAKVEYLPYDWSLNNK